MDTRFKPFLQTLEQEEQFRSELGESLFRSRFVPEKGGIQKAYEKGELTLADLKPLHLEAAWRITRMHAMAKMQLNPDQQLCHMLPEQWVAPMPDASNVSRSPMAQNLADIFAGLALQPTPDNVEDFVIALSLAARALLIPKTSLYLLDDTRTLLKFYPHPDEIAQEEHRFSLELSDTFLASGGTGVVKELVTKRGYLKLEAQSYLPLVKEIATENVYSDVVEDQKVMIARTESFLGRAQDALDLKSELGGLKHLATVQGLGKVEPENSATQFAEVLRELAAQEKEQRLIE